jgi:hypothetical protein
MMAMRRGRRKCTSLVISMTMTARERVRRDTPAMYAPAPTIAHTPGSIHCATRESQALFHARGSRLPLIQLQVVGLKAWHLQGHPDGDQPPEAADACAHEQHGHEEARGDAGAGDDCGAEIVDLGMRVRRGPLAASAASHSAHHKEHADGCKSKFKVCVT